MNYLTVNASKHTLSLFHFPIKSRIIYDEYTDDMIAFVFQSKEKASSMILQ